MVASATIYHIISDSGFRASLMLGEQRVLAGNIAAKTGFTAFFGRIAVLWWLVDVHGSHWKSKTADLQTLSDYE